MFKYTKDMHQSFSYLSYSAILIKHHLLIISLNINNVILIHFAWKYQQQYSEKQNWSKGIKNIFPSSFHVRKEASVVNCQLISHFTIYKAKTIWFTRSSARKINNWLHTFILKVSLKNVNYTDLRYILSWLFSV